MNKNDLNKNTRQPGIPSVLIVEDNKYMRLQLKHLLSKKYSIIEAGNGKEGKEKAFEEIPDLILCDVIMPGMNGIELCELIKQNPVTSHIPVILLTGKIDKSSKLDGLKTGADDYIIKPFDTEELQVRIENLIEQRAMLKIKFTENFGIRLKGTLDNGHDEKLIENIFNYVQKHVIKSEINVVILCKEVGMSQSKLYRKLKAITGHTPSELIRLIKVKHAANLMEDGYSISEAAFNSGFNSLSYFSSSFKKFIGKLPSEYFKK